MTTSFLSYKTVQCRYILSIKIMPTNRLTVLQIPSKHVGTIHSDDINRLTVIDEYRSIAVLSHQWYNC